MRIVMANETTKNGIYIINIIIGLLSSIVDNVPLVMEAVRNVSNLESGLYAVDGLFWEFWPIAWNWRICSNYRISHGVTGIMEYSKLILFGT